MTPPAGTVDPLAAAVRAAVALLAGEQAPPAVPLTAPDPPIAVEPVRTLPAPDPVDLPSIYRELQSLAAEKPAAARRAS